MQMDGVECHIPVLPVETIECVMPWTSGAVRVIDGTVGYPSDSLPK